MARCNDCNKFVQITGGDASCDVSLDDSSGVLVEIEASVCCEECGSDIKTATITAEIGEDAFADIREAHEKHLHARIDLRDEQDKRRAEKLAVDPDYVDGDDDVEVPDADMWLEADAEAELAVEDDDEHAGKLSKLGKPLKAKLVKKLYARGTVDVRCTCGCGGSTELSFEESIGVKEMDDA